MGSSNPAYSLRGLENPLAGLTVQSGVIDRRIKIRNELTIRDPARTTYTIGKWPIYVFPLGVKLHMRDGAEKVKQLSYFDLGPKMRVIRWRFSHNPINGQGRELLMSMSYPAVSPCERQIRTQSPT